MKIELITIGHEILSGDTLNTNALFIARHLRESGFKLVRETVLPDDKEVLRLGIDEALTRSDCVITTGGLGPTLDDLSRQVAADLFRVDFTIHEEVACDLKERFGDKLFSLEDQASVPRGARVFINKVGTAPGLILERDGKTLIMLPGVPVEMRPMFVEQVIPFICNEYPLLEKPYTKSIHLFEIPEMQVDPLLRELEKKYPNVAMGIYPSLGVLTVRLTVIASTEDVANELLTPPFQDIERKFVTNCFEAPSGLLEETVQRLFSDNGWTLSCAESCTGGHLAAQLTSLPGASKYFLGSIVSYANDLKTAALGVPQSMIESYGAVSQEVVSAMVEGVLRVSQSDFALAVSGIAGPAGGTPEKPVGTVWCAVMRSGGAPHVWKLKGRGTREVVIKRCVNSLLSHLLTYVKETSLL